MDSILVSEFALTISLVVGCILACHGVFEPPSRPNQVNPAQQWVPSDAVCDHPSWAASRKHTAAATQVALSISVLGKLAIALYPSYTGTLSLVFILQVALFVGGTTIACQAVAFADAESIIGAAFGIYEYNFATGEKGVQEPAITPVISPNQVKGVVLRILKEFPAGGMLLSHGTASALCVGAFVFESFVCMGVLFFAYLANEMRRDPLRAACKSTRQACWYSVKVFKTLAESLTYGCLFYYLLFVLNPQILGASLKNISVDASMSSNSAYILTLCIWCYLCFVGTAPLALVVLSRKIDYCRDRKAQPQPETIPQGAPVAVYSFNPWKPSASFRKSYFKQSIISLLVSAVATFLMLDLIPNSVDLHERLVLAAFVVLFSLNSIIFVSLFAFVRAWLSGELPFVWSFTDDQALIPCQGTVPENSKDSGERRRINGALGLEPQETPKQMDLHKVSNIHPR